MIVAFAAAWISCAQAAAAREIHFTLPAGFSVDRPTDLQGSFLSLTFGPDGSAYIGRESAGVVRLVDQERNDEFVRVEEVAPELENCQGLLVAKGALWAVGLREGKSGLWRVPLGANGQRSGASERVFEFTDGGEHGPHAIVAGPGGFAYLMVGNHAALGDAREHLGGYWAGDEGRLLAPYMDPLGFGAHVRYPGGFVARVDLAARTWQYVAVGLRNAYDLAFEESRGMYAVDSDMEWDQGLPWYRPVRLLEIIDGADYGSRAGSGVIPEWCPDTEPALMDLGRGSPTGAVFGTRAHFPLEWRCALFSGDWSQGRIVALWTGAHTSFDLRKTDFLTADTALPITDLEVGPEGGLWFLTGGRGTQGGVFRVTSSEPDSLTDDFRGRGGAARALLEQAARDLISGVVSYANPMQGAKLFTRFDRESWPLETRIAGAIATSEGLDRLLRSSVLEQRVGALIPLGRDPGVGSRPDKLVTSALALLDDLSPTLDARHELLLTVLRALELGLLRHGDPSPELASKLSARLLAMFPDPDARVASEIGVLLSHLDDERALGPLLAEMQKSPQELAIHYCDCAHRMQHGWDLERRRAMLEWFARSREYKGGISLPGYLTAMRAHFIEKLPAEACAELAPQEGIDAESLALLLARLPADKAAEFFPRFESMIARIVPAQFGTQEQVAKDAALRALEGLALPAVEELARKLAQSEGDVLEAPWTLLARTPQERDFDQWLAAIVSASAPKREAAFRVFASLARKPQSAEVWRSLLDQAREIGARRGRELLRTLARWSGAPSGDLEKPADFEAALAVLEQWYRASFPDGPPPTDPEARPHWSEAQMQAFLERAASRPGSAAHGRKVFETASCNSCHAIGRSPAIDSRGFGPDLANVTDRLSTADLLAAIVAPSRAISDQYRAFVARTKDERQFEGIVTRRDSKSVVLQPIGTSAIEIDADELESLEPSKRSPMPEGLLDSRTLEEIRDLFAYLKSPEASAPTSPWSPLLGREGLSGWNGDSSVWSLRATTIVGRSSGLSRSSYLLAKMPAQDLLVEFDVFLPPGGNSGLCYRAERPSAAAQSDPSGLQADLGQSYWGSLYSADGKTLAVADAKALEPALDRNGWNHVLVRFQGDRHSMEINGLSTYDTRADGWTGTQLGFQVHQGKPMLVRIANARWRAP